MADCGRGDQSESRIPDEATIRGWIRAARQGDDGAFCHLAEMFRHYLLHVANEELPADVAVKVAPSDLVQDSLIEAYRDLHRFGGTESKELKRWLRRILLNNLANTKRNFRTTGKRNLAREVAVGDPLHDGKAAHAVVRIPDPSPGPLEAAGIAEQEARLAAALARLPPLYALVIELRSHKRHPFAEIANELGRSEGACRKLWARAVELLRNELDIHND